MKESMQWIVTLIVSPIIVMVGMSAIVGMGKAANAHPSPVSAPVEEKNILNVKPEDIVTFNPNYFACNTIEDYDELVDRHTSGESSKVEEMFDDGVCFPLSPKEKFKVLSVKGGFLESFVEIVKANSGDVKNSFWTNKSFIKDIISR